MATYNSIVYAQSIGQPTTAAGVTVPAPTFVDGKRNGGTKRTILVPFDTSLQNLAIGSVINVAQLPQGANVVAATVISDTGTASATIQLGVSGNPAYFSTAGVSLATAGKVDVFTNLTDYNVDQASPVAIIATTAGAAINTGKLYFLIEYISN